MQNNDIWSFGMQTSPRIITIIFVYACTCVGDSGLPGKNGSQGAQGDVGLPGADGESLVRSISFQHVQANNN